MLFCIKFINSGEIHGCSAYFSGHLHQMSKKRRILVTLEMPDSTWYSLLVLPCSVLAVSLWAKSTTSLAHALQELLHGTFNLILNIPPI